MILSVFLFALISAIPTALALPEPIAAPPAEFPGQSFTSRGLYNAVAKVDLTYRICPRARYDCRAMGQFANGTHITLDCYTTENTTPVNGDDAWGKLAGNGYWVAVAGGEYVGLSDALPYC